MTSETLARLKEIVVAGQSFLIISGEDGAEFTEREMLARRALRLALQARGALVNGYPSAPSEVSEKWNSILPETGNRDFPYSTTIVIPKDQVVIKEVSYADEGPTFSITIESLGQGLSREAVIFESNPIALDGLILFRPLKRYPSIIGSRLLLPPAGQIVTLSPDGNLATREVYEATIAILGETAMPQTIATVLLAALILETNNFTEHTGEEVLALGSTLLAAGADKEAIRAILRKEMTYGFAQLLGRALARTRHDPELKTVLVFLSAADLEKTGHGRVSETIVRAVLKKVRELVPRDLLYTVFWEKREGVSLLVSAEENDEGRSLLTGLASRLRAEVGSGSLLLGPFANFSEAELALQKALKDVLRSYTI